MIEIELSGWSDGRPDWGGSLFGFGLRVSMKDREIFRKYSTIKLELPRPAGKFYRLEVAITPSFWRKCPELRHKKIGEWMWERGDCLPEAASPWPDGKGRPPRYKAEVRKNYVRVIG